MTKRTTSRVAMIGLDAAELGFIQVSLSSLPHLRRAFERGTLCQLESTADLLAGSVWPTFYTGAPPGEHGIYHHLQWDAEAMQLRRVSADWLYCEPFWYELERRGLWVITIDVPMTFPSRLTRGVEVTNWGSHDQLGPFTAHPRELERDIRRRFGSSHPMGYEIPVNKTRSELMRIRDNLVAGVKRKAQLARWLLGAQAWDFCLIVFGECHRGGHILWPEDSTDSVVPANALLEVYQAVDDALGQLLEALPSDETSVMIFALHGMGPNNSQEHFVRQIMQRVNEKFWNEQSATVKLNPPRGQRSVMRLLRDKVPARLQNMVAQAMPVAVRDFVVNRATTAGYDWSRTVGLALLADLNGYLRLNLRGREKLGAVEPGSESLARYVEWLRECFQGLRIGESGESLVKELRFAGEELTGRRSRFLPDVVVTWTGAEPTSHIRSELIGDLSVELATGRSGNHRPDGFCLRIDPGETSVIANQPRHILDLASIVRRQLFRD